MSLAEMSEHQSNVQFHISNPTIFVFSEEGAIYNNNNILYTHSGSNEIGHCLVITWKIRSFE